MLDGLPVSNARKSMIRCGSTASWRSAKAVSSPSRASTCAHARPSEPDSCGSSDSRYCTSSIRARFSARSA